VSIPAATGSDRDRTAFDPGGWRLAAAWILIIAMFLRFYDLELKPLHHDEGVNGFFLINLIRSPANYRYDPANYHGPTLYYFARASAALLGLTTVAIRFVPAFFGWLTVAVALALRRQLGDVGSLMCAALIACSPGAVYMSRYFIHEALLVCFMLTLVLAAARYASAGRARDLLLAAAAAGLMFATKETAVIAAAVMFMAVVMMAVLGFATHRRELNETIRSTMVRALRSPATIVSALAIFLGVNAAFFSSFGTHPEAAAAAVKSFALWASTGTAAHIHPWWNYLSWLVQEEAPTVILGTIGIALALKRRSGAFAVFAAWWALGMVAAYSMVPYKTPWLTLNLIVPLAIAAGYAADQMFRLSDRRVWTAAAAAVIAATLTQSIRLNFFRYDDNAYPYVYVHTSRDIFRLVKDVERAADARPRHGQRTHLTVTSPHQFPLSWYLRDYDVGYYDKVVASRDPVVIAWDAQEEEFARVYGNSYRRLDTYDLRPGVRLVVYVRNEPDSHTGGG